MCIGLALQVKTVLNEGLVLCLDPRDRGQLCPVSTLLLDATPVTGDWLLVHIDTAVRALGAEEALDVANAWRAVERAARGEPFEHLIADLIDREPELPEHLRPGAAIHPKDAAREDMNHG